MTKRDDTDITSPGDGRDDRSPEDILADYVDRLTAGEKISPQDIAREHPEHGRELLDHLENFMEISSEVETPDPLGTLGDYTLRRQIGRGGMGVVYDAWQGSLDRQVALKVLPAGLAADTKATGRFLREAQVAAKLKHPQVVAVYGFGVEQNTPYFSMEYVEGETLAQILLRIMESDPESETPFGQRDEVGYFANIAKAFADVADGLQHAHSKGVVHRDIKPSNLILDQEGRLRILDFGLARLEGQESLTISGDLVGTPLYMSPEQARKRKIKLDHRTDVYSLGATMYETLTGRPPLKGKDHQETLSRIIDRDPVEPRSVNASVPADLETIVLKCLRKDPGDRYAAAEALAEDLRRYARGEAIAARPQGAWGKLRGRLVRHRRRYAVRLLIAALILACLGLVYEKLIPEPREDTFDNVVRVPMINSDYVDSSPTASSDGRELYFCSDRREERKNGGDIYVAWREQPRGPWEGLRHVEELNTPSHEAPGWLSHDGLRLYYVHAPENSKNESIFLATRDERNVDSPWRRSDNPEFVRRLNSEYIDNTPSLTADEKTIFFSSKRPGTAGKRDLWWATRTNREAPWGEPRKLEEINTAAGELWPCVSADGLVLWWAETGRGDMFYATRRSREDRFMTRGRLESPINTPAWEGHFEVTHDWPTPGALVYFMRGHSLKRMDIYRATWMPASDSRTEEPGAGPADP